MIDFMMQSPLISCAFMALENDDWNGAESFFNQALSVNQNDPYACLGKLMILVQVKSLDELKESPKDFENTEYWQRAVKFADGELQTELALIDISRKGVALPTTEITEKSVIGQEETDSCSKAVVHGYDSVENDDNLQEEITNDKERFEVTEVEQDNGARTDNAEKTAEEEINFADNDIDMGEFSGILNSGSDTAGGNDKSFWNSDYLEQEDEPDGDRTDSIFCEIAPAVVLNPDTVKVQEQGYRYDQTSSDCDNMADGIGENGEGDDTSDDNTDLMAKLRKFGVYMLLLIFVIMLLVRGNNPSKQVSSRYKKNSSQTLSLYKKNSSIGLYSSSTKRMQKKKMNSNGQEKGAKVRSKIDVNEKGMTYIELFDKGNNAYKDKQYQLAIGYYTKAIELNPTLAYIYNNRGLMYCALQQYDEAIVDYTKAIKLDPTYAVAYYNRGHTYHDLEQYDEAIVDYTKAIQFDPVYAAAYGNRGVVYRCLDQNVRALSDLNRAIELDPKDVPAYTTRGNVYGDLKQYSKAIADHTKAIELNPNYVEAYYNRGLTYHNVKQYDAAIADYTKAIKLDPELVVAYGNRGWAYYSQGDYDLAKRDANKVLTLVDNGPEADKARELLRLCQQVKK